MSAPIPETAPDPLDAAFSASWLTAQDLPPVEYAVPGLVPEGLTLLVSAPKVGKSWMVLGLGVACATGGVALGSIRVKARPVLYLALEDGKRRLQSRLRALGVTTGPRDLTFMLDLPGGLIATIGAFLKRHADERPLVVLDTLGKVRATFSGHDVYGRDYSEMSALKRLTDAHPGSSLVVVHHTAKGAREDFLDSVSGTQGLAGAADSILVLRRDRQTGTATLHATSRDAAEGEYAVSLTDGRWTLDGATLRDASAAVQQRTATQGVGDDMTELIVQVGKYPEGSRPKDLATMMHWPESKVRLYLRRATESGRVANPRRGVYTPVTLDTSETFPDDLDPDSYIVSEVTGGL